MGLRNIWMTKEVEMVLAELVLASKKQGQTISHEQAAQKLIGLGISYSRMVAREKKE